MKIKSDIYVFSPIVYNNLTISGIEKKGFSDLSIHIKILIISLFSSVLIIAFIVFFQETLLRKSFPDLEGKYRIQNMERTENILQRELIYLDKLLQDWCMWDETYYFIESENMERNRISVYRKK
ncbi:MAG: hypothetical protein JEY91_18160 [Spirochaetaceae bacterium]|nr:hypothetical protein [Spirochaetaceae bacterium]